MIIIYLIAGLLNSEESKRGCSELLKKHFIACFSSFDHQMENFSSSRNGNNKQIESEGLFI